jgi:hypothetical protein
MWKTVANMKIMVGHKLGLVLCVCVCVCIYGNEGDELMYRSWQSPCSKSVDLEAKVNSICGFKAVFNLWSARK